MPARGLKDFDGLPAVPVVAREILEVLNDHHAGLAEIARVLSREPGLTGRLVASANAAFFTGQRPIYTVDDATVRLGLNRVRTIAMSILIGQKFNPAHCPAFSIRRFWFQAMKTADCASKLVRLVPVETAKDAATLCGLLHNIGLLALAYAYPERMGQVLDGHAGGAGRSLAERERAEFGFDHHEAGAELLRRWGMPPEVAAAVGEYGNPAYAGEYTLLAQVVRIAGRWSENDFTVAPPAGILRGVDDVKLRHIADSCRRERSQLEAFALTLCAA
jgi:HD-like signal output (HDOD) protein